MFDIYKKNYQKQLKYAYDKPTRFNSNCYPFQSTGLTNSCQHYHVTNSPLPERKTKHLQSWQVATGTLRQVPTRAILRKARLRQSKRQRQGVGIGSAPAGRSLPAERHRCLERQTYVATHPRPHRIRPQRSGSRPEGAMFEIREADEQAAQVENPPIRGLVVPLKVYR